jgi:phage major head subunit gpT-like protein
MGIAGAAANLINAQTEYDAAYQEVFDGGVTGLQALFAKTVPITAKRLSVPVVTSFPDLREWIGSRFESDLRSLKQDIDIKTYESSIKIKRLDLDADASGAVSQSVGTFVRQAPAMIDRKATAALTANTSLGYDGVVLGSSAHPYVGSAAGTFDNTTSAVLSFESFRAQKAVMMSITDESGRNLGMNPSALMVGPSNLRLALEIVGAQRPVSVKSDGTYDQTSAVGATAIENVFQGECNVIYNPYLVGSAATFWYLMDLSRPGVRPIMRALFREVEAITQLEMNAQPRMDRDEYIWALEGDFQYVAGLWQSVTGKFA